MRFIYDIAIFFYQLVIRTFASFNPKAKKWVEGRKGIFDKISSEVNPNEQIVWFHCASLGEFEQGRPVIENLKSQISNLKILLTFFSPSGYEIRKNYEHADYVFYLPLDTDANAKKFIDLVNPKTAFFVKYEFWHHYISELKKRNIPLFVISANFRPEQHFFKWYGRWFTKMLKNTSHIFVQNEDSLKLLNSIGIESASVSGDTRFDRVAQIAETSEKMSLIATFKSNKKALIAGSTWPDDEKLLVQYINSPQNDLKYIIAPHEIGEKHVQQILSSIQKPVVRFSDLKKENAHEFSVLVIDTIGHLSKLYCYGDIAYIGGGFGDGIHNTLEAAVFGMPVLFGPNYQKFREAIELIEKGGAFSINNYSELERKLNWLQTDAFVCQMAAHISKNYVDKNRGATERILEKTKVYFQ